MRNHFDPVFGFPQFVRFSWGTAKKMIEKNGIPLEFESDDDEDQENNEETVLQMNGKKRKKKGGEQMQLFKTKRAAVFRNARLERASLF